jgi:hypothetical protein
MKENGGGDELSKKCLIYCKKFGNATMYPHPAQLKTIK